MTVVGLSVGRRDPRGASGGPDDHAGGRRQGDGAPERNHPRRPHRDAGIGLRHRSDKTGTLTRNETMVASTRNGGPCRSVSGTDTHRRGEFGSAMRMSTRPSTDRDQFARVATCNDAARTTMRMGRRVEGDRRRVPFMRWPARSCRCDRTLGRMDVDGRIPSRRDHRDMEVLDDDPWARPDHAKGALERILAMSVSQGTVDGGRRADADDWLRGRHRGARSAGARPRRASEPQNDLELNTAGPDGHWC